MLESLMITLVKRNEGWERTIHGKSYNLELVLKISPVT